MRRILILSLLAAAVSCGDLPGREDFPEGPEPPQEAPTTSGPADNPTRPASSDPTQSVPVPQGGEIEDGNQPEEGTAEAVPDDTIGEQPDAGAPGRVVLNEVYYDADGSDTDGVLFIELFGTAGLSLAGYRIDFINGADGDTYTSLALPEDAAIREDSFFVVADVRNGSSDATQVEGADWVVSFDPQNGPDAVRLIDPGGAVVDAVGYGEGLMASDVRGLPLLEGAAAPDVAGGHSLERIAPGHDTDDNGADFVERETPNPGV